MNDKTTNINHLDKASFLGQIITVTRDEDIAHAVELLLASNDGVMGFDTETKPSFKKGESYKVSLLQLSTGDVAILFRLHYLKSFSLIKEIFEDASIIKTGVAIRDDLKSLQKLFNFTPTSFVELADLAKEKNLKNFGLKGMTEEVLDLTLSKKAKLSNWQAQSLNEDQLLYAATDAWIGRELYKKIKTL